MNDITGKIVVIKRSGVDGPEFPIGRNKKKIVFGRDQSVDVRVQLAHVAQEHCHLLIQNNGKVLLENLSEVLPTRVNQKLFEQTVELLHKDVFSISDRQFRFEYTKTPEKQITPKKRSISKTPLGNSPRTPEQLNSLKNSIKHLRRHSDNVKEEVEPVASPMLIDAPLLRRSPRIIDKENNTPKDNARKTPRSILRKSTQRKRVSFGMDLSPEYFDKTLPPSTPVRRGESPLNLDTRKKSEPLLQHALSFSTKKRYSVGTQLSTVPIAEEDTESQLLTPEAMNNVGHSILDVFADSPSINKILPSPLQAEVVGIASDEKDFEPSPIVPMQLTNTTESVDGYVNNKKSSEKRRVLKTPLRKAIQTKPLLRRTLKKGFNTPLRNQIRKGHQLRKTLKKLQTPLKKDIQAGTKLKETKKRMQTPLKKDIESGISLKQTKKKLQTPLKKDIQAGIKLKQTKKRLQTPLKKDIQAGIKLKQTKKRLQTPLKKDIQTGVKLKETKKKMQTPLKKDIQAGIKLKETKKKMQTPLRKDIEAGIKLKETKKKMQTPLKKDIQAGIKLQKTKKKMQTPLRKDIEAGIKLKETKKKMQTPLKKDIEAGIKLRETKKKMQTPLRKEIEAGIKLKETKKKMQTPLRKDIEAGIKLKETKKKMQTALKKDIEAGIKLRETKKKMQTPLRKDIEAGIKLMETKKKMQTPLRKDIEAGIKLKETKKKTQNPLKNIIHAGKDNVAPIPVNLIRPILKAKRHFPKINKPDIDSTLFTFSGLITEAKVGFPARKRARRDSTPYKKPIMPDGVVETAAYQTPSAVDNDEGAFSRFETPATRKKQLNESSDNFDAEAIQGIFKPSTAQKTNYDDALSVVCERIEIEGRSMQLLFKTPIAKKKSESEYTETVDEEVIQRMLKTPAAEKRTRFASSLTTSVNDVSSNVIEGIEIEDESMQLLFKTPIAQKKVNKSGEVVDEEAMQKMIETPATEKRTTRASSSKTPVNDVSSNVIEGIEIEDESMQLLFKTPIAQKKVNKSGEVVDEEAMQKMFKTPATEKRTTGCESPNVSGEVQLSSSPKPVHSNDEMSMPKDESVVDKKSSLNIVAGLSCGAAVLMSPLDAHSRRGRNYSRDGDFIANLNNKGNSVLEDKVDIEENVVNNIEPINTQGRRLRSRTSAKGMAAVPVEQPDKTKQNRNTRSSRCQKTKSTRGMTVSHVLEEGDDQFSNIPAKHTMTLKQVLETITENEEVTSPVEAKAKRQTRLRKARCPTDNENLHVAETTTGFENHPELKNHEKPSKRVLGGRPAVEQVSDSEAPLRTKRQRMTKTLEREGERVVSGGNLDEAEHLRTDETLHVQMICERITKQTRSRKQPSPSNLENKLTEICLDKEIDPSPTTRHRKGKALQKPQTGSTKVAPNTTKGVDLKPRRNARNRSAAMKTSEESHATVNGVGNEDVNIIEISIPPRRVSKRTEARSNSRHEKVAVFDTLIPVEEKLLEKRPTRNTRKRQEVDVIDITTAAPAEVCDVDTPISVEEKLLEKRPTRNTRKRQEVEVDEVTAAAPVQSMRPRRGRAVPQKDASTKRSRDDLKTDEDIPEPFPKRRSTRSRTKNL